MKKRNGFTLIEIMVVVAVVGLLAALASLAVTKSHQKAIQKQVETELQILSAATLQLAWDTGRWPNKARRNNPGSTEIWQISMASAGLMATDGSYDNWKGPYYEGSLLDPWGNPYFFDPDYFEGGIARIVVGSFGPNGQGRNVYDSDNKYEYLDD